MCRSAQQPGGRHRTRFRRTATLVLAATLCLFPLAAHAQGAGNARKANPPEATQEVAGGVIEITGVMERPRAETRLPWAAPDGFAREPDVAFGRALREEILTPVDRNDLRRLLELERSLGPGTRPAR
jgi:hypothetical protein